MNEVVFVTGKNGEFGVGKRIDSDPENRQVTVELFESPIEAERRTIEVRADDLAPASIDAETRVYFFDKETQEWRIGRVHDRFDGKLFLSLPNQQTRTIAEVDGFVRWSGAEFDPWQHLVARLNETAFFHAVRSPLQKNLVAQRAACRGMTAVTSSPIEIERHQIDVIRRVLNDPQCRYLLADEVGLGKTIEAGVIVRQHILDHPRRHRVLVIVPAGLVTQWRDELEDRCRVGATFSHRVEIINFEAVARWQGEQPTFIVVDEAHRLVSGDGAAFQSIRTLSNPNRCAGLLLLSATPVRRNETGFHRLLHLLDPEVHQLSDEAGFRKRVENRDQLSAILGGFRAGEDAYFLEGYLDDLRALFPHDAALTALLDAVEQHLDVAEKADALNQAIEATRTHLSETYRLHRRVLRNRRESLEAGAITGREKFQPIPWRNPGMARLESVLERWRVIANRAPQAEPSVGAALFVQWLESAWIDPLDFLARVQSRFTTPTFPHFDGELDLLTEILDSKNAIKKDREEFLDFAQEVANAVVSDGDRLLCFSSSERLADDFHSRLKMANPSVVNRYAPDETAWRDRWESGAIRVVICDARAEEGLNLQGPGVKIFHLDLPFSPNRIEQRIGRLDRYGVGTATTSLAIEPSACPVHSAWIACLDQGWGVFSESIASLYELINPRLNRLAGELFQRGAAALSDSISELENDIATELRQIKNQDALNALNDLGQEETAAICEALRKIEADEISFRDTFSKWMGSVLQFIRVGETDKKDPVVRFHYRRPAHGKSTLIPFSEFQRFFLPALDANAQHPVFSQPLTGAVSFRRKEARARRTCLARVGNSLVDAVAQHLRHDDRGRTFAIWRQTQTGTNHGTRAFFRIDFLIETNLSPEIDGPVLCRKGDAAFPPQMTTVWIDHNLATPEADIRKVLELEFSKPEDVNIHSENWNAVLQSIGCLDWTSLCETVRASADRLLEETANLSALKTETGQRHANRSELIAVQWRSRLAAMDDDDPGRSHLEQEIADHSVESERIAEAIRSPRVKIDSCGVIFLSSKPFFPRPRE